MRGSLFQTFIYNLKAIYVFPTFMLRNLLVRKLQYLKKKKKMRMKLF